MITKTITGETETEVLNKLNEVERDYAHTDQIILKSPVYPCITLGKTTYVCYISVRSEQEHSAIEYQIAEYSKLSYKGD